MFTNGAINISRSSGDIIKGYKYLIELHKYFKVLKIYKGYEHFVKLYKYFLGLEYIQKSDINIDRTPDKFLGLGKYNISQGF